MHSCWVLHGVLHSKEQRHPVVLTVWRRAACSALQDPTLSCPVSSCHQAGVNRWRALREPSCSPAVSHRAAHMKCGSDHAQLLHSCNLSTLHFLFKLWSCWTSLFFPVCCGLITWKEDCLNSQWYIHTIELFSFTFFFLSDESCAFVCQNMYLKFCKGKKM